MIKHHNDAHSTLFHFKGGLWLMRKGVRMIDINKKYMGESPYDLTEFSIKYRTFFYRNIVVRNI